MTELEMAIEAIKKQRAEKVQAIDNAIRAIDEAKRNLEDKRVELAKFDAELRAKLTPEELPAEVVQHVREMVTPKERRSVLLKLAKEGILSPSILSQKTSYPIFKVNADIRFLRNRDLWPSSSRKNGSQTSSAVDDGDEDSINEGRSGSVDEIVAEIKKQQNGNPIIQAKLGTSRTRKHNHAALVNLNGTGTTVSDKTGHSHDIKDFIVLPYADHMHDLTI